MGDTHLISNKKALYPVSDFLRTYLSRYGRIWADSIRYDDLGRFTNAIPVYDEKGFDTLWSTVLYSDSERTEIHEKLLNAYAILKADGDISITKYLFIDRVDQCNHGNTLPFRVRVVNRINENFDYFYVKKIDANRIYGLELEHILSPNRINYFIHRRTIVEEHIIGIPADAFLKEDLPITDFDRVRLAKEFVKFNERCFVSLLGDMHSGNFVIELTRDFEKWHFRIHSIDFDQQSHHWRKEVYLPQFFSSKRSLPAVNDAKPCAGKRSAIPEGRTEPYCKPGESLARTIQCPNGGYARRHHFYRQQYRASWRPIGAPLSG